jgi:citrate lyase subunit beta/citryl-CoA lyase
MFRSLLFVPGDSARKLEKALTTQADALILDLEDSVAPSAKDSARASVAEALRGVKTDKFMIVRINALSTPQPLLDLKAVVGLADAIMLPKCEGGRDAQRAGCYIEAFEVAAGREHKRTKLLPIVTETARSVLALTAELESSERLMGLVWGAEDLASDLGAFGNKDGGAYRSPYRLARDLCLFAAAGAGLMAIDTVYADIADLDGLAREAAAAKRDGFAAKMAIHPSQVDVINQAFTPTQEETDWAEAVAGAFAASPGAGALRLDGRMIDQPHLKLARRILSR